MRATIIHGAGDVRVETVPDPKILEPTDAVVRVVSACICGSDLWPYRSMPASEIGARIGHEFLGLVEDTGAGLEGFKSGDLVVAPFVWSDGTCDFCHQGLQTSCRHGGMWARDGIDGGQGEAVRVPQAAGIGALSPPGAHVAGEHAESDRVSGTHRPDRVEHRHAEAVGVAAWCRPAVEWAQLLAACGDHKIDVPAGR